MGAEFTGPVAKYLENAGIVHATKNPAQVNTLAVVDRAIGKYKSILRNFLTKEGGTWSSYVKNRRKPSTTGPSRTSSIPPRTM